MGGYEPNGIAETDGFHIEAAGEPIDVDEEPEAHVGSSLDDAIDAFSEGFNARDLDALFDVLSGDCELPGFGGDRDNFGDTVEQLWETRPTCLCTRGDLDGQPVGVLWEVGDDGRWWKVAPVAFEEARSGRLAVVELIDDEALLDAIDAPEPEREFDEGARWSDWDEGAGD